MHAYEQYQPDIIILDINLPTKDGITLVGELRQITTTPILMLSARDDQRNIVQSLELGADDYVSKPFSPKEIISRIKAILRRGTTTKTNISTSGESRVQIELDENSLIAIIDNQEIPLTKSEFFLLKRIQDGDGKVVKREELMNEIMGYNNYVVDRTIDTHIKNIRKKVGEEKIATVRGLGYKIQ